MPVLYADGTVGEQNFGDVRQRDDIYLDITMTDENKVTVDILPLYVDAIWELEGVEFNITKSFLAGEITFVNDHLARVPLNRDETDGLLGTYTHQLRLIRNNGTYKIVTEGEGTFKSEVF